MAEGYRAGTVYIDVEPDTRGFYREVKAMLERLDDHTIDLDANLDTAGVRAQMERLQRSGGTINFDARLNVRAFDKVHRQLAELASSTDIDVDVDTSDFDKSLNDAMNRQRARVRQLGEEQKRTWREGWRYLDENTAKHKALGDSILANQVEYAKLGKAIDAAAKHRDSFKRRSDEYRAASDEVKRLRKEYTKLGRSIAKQKKELASTEEERRRYLRDHESKLSKINAEYDKQAEILKDMPVRAHNKQLKELASNLFKAEGNVDALRRAMSRVQFVDMKSQVKDLDVLTERVSDLQKRLLAVKDSPEKTVKFRTELDESGLREDLARLQRDVQVEVRVNAQQAAIDRLRRELRELEHTRVDIPVDIKADFENAIAEHRRLIEQIRRDPELDWEVKSNVDIDETNARRRLRDLQDDYKTLEMDLDLKSKLASAHLAYFTRPRTVDIFAKFHGTDLGKILGGMTAGATGIKGVQNQFQHLVNLFDSLDKVVPKVGMLGTVLAGIGAGAINLSGSVLGVGSSIVTMSKAALAAPAALTGLGAAYASLRMIIGDKGAAWKENISVAGTELENMAEKVQKAFYGKAAPAIQELAKQVGGVLSPAMVQLAEHEGEIVDGITRMIIESNKAGQIEGVFSNVNKSFSELRPGIESVVTAFINLGDTTSRYLPLAASYLSDLASQFSRWVDSARLSGEINHSLSSVVEQAGYLKSALKGVVDIASGLYKGLASQQNGLESFARAVGNAADAVNGVRFQETLQAWARGSADAKERVRGAFSDIGDAAYELRDVTADVFRNAGSTISSFSSNMGRLLRNSGSGISKFASGVSDGFVKVFDAIGDSAPMFDQLLTTVGKLSSTFGGTLGASLRAAAPLIEAMANGAEAVATAFSKLPEPVQAAIGLWATFGRAGMSAFDSLKMGILDSTAKTLQYQKMLTNLGVSATGFGVSMKEAVRGFAAASPALSSVSGAVENATGKFGKFKALAGGLFSAVNWPVAGAVAAIGAVTMALSDINQKASANQQIVTDVASAFGRLADEGYDASTSLNAVEQALRDALNNPDLGETSFLDDLLTGVSETSDAMKTLGITTDEALSLTSSSTEDFQREMDRLSDAIEDGTTVTQSYGSTMGHTSVQLSDTAKASEKYKKSMEALRKEYIEAAEKTATANGYTEGYAKSLIEAGISSDQLAVKIATQSQRAQMAARATKMHVDSLNEQRVASRNAMSAASNYQATLSGMKDTIARVKELTSEQNTVWDKSSTLLPGVEGAFNTMSESGRLAQQSLETLGSSAHDVMEKMVASGASTGEVTKAQQRMREEFINTARDMGVPAAAAQQLADQYGLIPSEVDTIIKVHAEEAKSTIAVFLANMRAFFPNDNGAVFDYVLNLVMNGDIKSIDDAYKKVQELKNGGAENLISILLELKKNNAVVDLDRIKSALKELGMSDTDLDINVNTLEGQMKLDSIRDKLKQLGMSDNDIKVILNAFGADNDLDRLRRRLEELSNSDTKVPIDADTDSAKAKMSAFIDDKSMKKTIPADLSLDEADGQLMTFAAKSVKKPIEAEASQSSLSSALSMVIAAVTGAVIPPAKFNVEGNNDDAMSKIQAVQSFGGVVLATALSYVLGDNQQAKNVMGEIAAYDGRTIARPWDRVVGENNVAFAIMRAIMRYDGSTIARPWARVQGENSMARMVIAAIQMYNGLTIARPWARVEGDSSGADAVISAIGATNGTVIATRYVDIVTRGNGEVHAATGGRIHGPGTGTSDSIPALLSNNEHVIRAAAVEKLDRTVGPNFLHVLNRTGDVQKALSLAGRKYMSSARSLSRGAYATGGRVSASLMGRHDVVLSSGRTVNQTFNLQTKIVRSDQDLHAAAQIDKSALMRNAMREARI